MSTDLVQPGATIQVKIDGKQVDDLVPLSIERTLGAQAGDRCVCHLANQEQLVDLKIKDVVDRYRHREIVITATEPNGRAETLFVGWGSGVAMGFGTETQDFEFRIARYHFGDPLVGVKQRLPPGSKKKPPAAASSEGLRSVSREELAARSKPPEEEAPEGARVTYVVRDLVFNPLIDGVVRGNKHEIEGQFLGFIDWESLRTKEARRYLGYARSSDEAFRTSEYERLWDVQSAVVYLCETLNHAEQFIVNPTKKDLTDVFGERPMEIRNRNLPIGLYLNECLEQLLTPLGYTYFVGVNSNGRPQLYFRERGYGPRRPLQLQKPGPFDYYKNSTDGGSLGVGAASLIDTVVIYTAPKRHEVTIELVPAWKDEYDDLGDNETVSDSEEYLQRPEYRDVHRKFAANEAGDYIGYRSGIKKPYDLKEIFGYDPVTKRRAIHPCLTRNLDGTPVGDNGIVIEWKLASETATSVEEAEAQWKPLSEMQYDSVELLDQEIGIRFNGLFAPVETVNNPAAVRIRITGTIEEDALMSAATLSTTDVETKYKPTKSKKAAEPHKIRHVVDARDRYHWRKVHRASRHFKKVESGELQADEIDEQSLAYEYAARIINRWDTLDVNGSFRIIGLTSPWYELGDAIYGIEGRDVNFSSGQKSQRYYPQIAGISYDLIGQSRQVTLQTLRNDAR